MISRPQKWKDARSGGRRRSVIARFLAAKVIFRADLISFTRYYELLSRDAMT